jgi:hypothetical protein
MLMIDNIRKIFTSPDLILPPKPLNVKSRNKYPDCIKRELVNLFLKTKSYKAAIEIVVNKYPYIDLSKLTDSTVKNFKAQMEAGRI